MAGLFDDVLGPEAAGTPPGLFDDVLAAPKPSSFLRRAVADTALAGAQGVVGLGESVVGLADIPTLGRAGKALNAVKAAGGAGLDYLSGNDTEFAKNYASLQDAYDKTTGGSGAHQFLEELKTPEQQQANRAVAEAKGFGGTLTALAQNPSVIPQKIAETIPLIAGGGAIARALPAALSPIARGAFGEGLLGAGSSAEQTRQASPTGTITPSQAALALTSGALTGAITKGAGTVANKLGIGDIEQLLAGGKITPAQAKGVLRRGAEGAVVEGLLEEAPQSAQEQALQNIALGKPLGEGVPEATALGGVLGSVIGGGVAALPQRAPLAAVQPGVEAVPGAVPPAGPVAPDWSTVPGVFPEGQPVEPGAPPPLAPGWDTAPGAAESMGIVQPPPSGPIGRALAAAPPWQTALGAGVTTTPAEDVSGAYRDQEIAALLQESEAQKLRSRDFAPALAQQREQQGEMAMARGRAEGVGEPQQETAMQLALKEAQRVKYEKKAKTVEAKKATIQGQPAEAQARGPADEIAGGRQADAVGGALAGRPGVLADAGKEQIAKPEADVGAAIRAESAREEAVSGRGVQAGEAAAGAGQDEAVVFGRLDKIRERFDALEARGIKIPPAVHDAVVGPYEEYQNLESAISPSRQLHPTWAKRSEHGATEAERWLQDAAAHEAAPKHGKTAIPVSAPSAGAVSETTPTTGIASGEIAPPAVSQEAEKPAKAAEKEDDTVAAEESRGALGGKAAPQKEVEEGDGTTPAEEYKAKPPVKYNREAATGRREAEETAARLTKAEVMPAAETLRQYEPPTPAEAEAARLYRAGATAPEAAAPHAAAHRDIALEIIRKSMSLPPGNPLGILKGVKYEFTSDGKRLKVWKSGEQENDAKVFPIKALEKQLKPEATPAKAETPAQRTASEWATEKARLNSVKPRPLTQLYGPNPTQAQRASHGVAFKKWAAEYRKASAAQKVALVRDNAAFLAKRTAAETKTPEPETKPAAKESAVAKAEAPTFKTLDDYHAWMRAKAKEYGSKAKLAASEEYARLYPSLKEQFKRLSEEAKKTARTVEPVHSETYKGWVLEHTDTEATSFRGRGMVGAGRGMFGGGEPHTFKTKAEAEVWARGKNYFLAPPVIAPAPEAPSTEAKAPAIAAKQAPATALPWAAADSADTERLRQLEGKRLKTQPQEKQIERLKKRIAADPRKWSVGEGVGWRAVPGQINRGYRIRSLDLATKTAVIRSVADTGLTNTGGDRDVLSDESVHVADLVRDKKYDRPAPKFSYAGERGAATPKHALAAAREFAAQGVPMEEIRKTTGWFKTKDAEPGNERWRYELSDKDATLKPNWDAYGNTVGDALDHKILFENYPSLAKIDLVFRFDLPANVTGGYAPADNAIHLNANLTPAGAKSTLLHELQHGVQTIEGFARGGKPSDKAFISAAAAMGIDTNDKSAMLSAYKRLLGEVEARDVQARMNLTAEELRARPPYVSQGIPESEFIVQFKGEGAASMASGQSAASLRANLAKRLGTRAIAGLERAGFEIVETEEQLPEGARPKSGKAVRGVYWKGKSYLVARNIPQASELSVLLHEVGVHHGLEGLLGTKLHRALLGNIKATLSPLERAIAEEESEAELDAIRARIAAQSPLAKALVAARSRLPNDTKAGHINEEVLAYTVEDNANRNLTLVKRVLGAIRAWLLRHGFQLKEIRVEDLVAMARASVHAVSREATVQRRSSGEAVPAYSQKALPDEVPVVSLTGGTFTVKPEELWRTANEYYRDNLQGTREPNAWLGGEVVFSAEGRKEAFSIGRRSVLRMSAVKALRDLVRQAVPIESMLDERAREDIRGFTHAVAPLEIEGEVYAVRLNFKELTRAPGRPRFFTFAGFEIAEPSAIDRGDATQSGGLRGSPGSAQISIERLMEAIKGRPLFSRATSDEKERAAAPRATPEGGVAHTPETFRSRAEPGNEPSPDTTIGGQGGPVKGPQAPMYSRAAATLPGRPQGAPLLDNGNVPPPTPFNEENRRLREEDKTTWNRAKTFWKRNFTPGGLLPAQVFEQKNVRDGELGVVELDTENLVAQLDAAVKAVYGKRMEELTADQRGVLQEALTGKVVEGLDPRARTVIESMRQHVDRLSGEYVAILEAETAEMTASGDPTAEARAGLLRTITGNLGRYVHRSYRAFDDPQWFSKLPNEVIDAAREYLRARYVEGGMEPDEAAEKAERALHTIVKTGTAYDSMEAFIRESKLGAKDLSILQRRKDIAPQIRALLGEYDDPRLNYAKSTSKMARLIWNTRFLDRVREIGMGTFLFEEKDAPPGTVKIAADASEVHSPLNGLFTFREIDQAFQDAVGKEKMDDWYRVIVQMNGAVKYGKVILSPTTQIRNFMSAAFFALANGHFDIRHVAKSVDTLRGKSPEYARLLVRLGIMDNGAYAGEMMQLIRDSKIEEILRDKKSTPYRVWRDLNAFAKKAYRNGDDFWKIVGFENEKASLMKVGVPEAQAEREAAERIRNTYPTYSMVGRGIKWLARFPLAGTFVSFPAEIIRTSGHMLRYVAKDYQDPQRRPLALRRAAGMAMVSGFAYALQAMTMAMMGMDDDEEEAVRRLAAPWQRNSNFLFTGRDEKGQLRYFDLSFLDPYNWFKRPITAILRDQPWEDKAVGALTDMLSPFLGTDIAAGALFEVLANKKESGGEVFNEFATPVAQSVAIADHLRKALQPGFVGNMERTYRAVKGDYTPSGKKYDLADEGMSWIGWRVTTLEPKTALYYRSFEFADAKAAATATLTRTLRSPNEVSREAIADAKASAQRQLSQGYKDMRLIVGAAMKNGLSRSDVIRVLRTSGVALRDIPLLLSDREPTVRISPQQIRNASVQARALYGPEKAAEIRQRYQEASRSSLAPVP